MKYRYLVTFLFLFSSLFSKGFITGNQQFKNFNISADASYDFLKRYKKKKPEQKVELKKEDIIVSDYIKPDYIKKDNYLFSKDKKFEDLVKSSILYAEKGNFYSSFLKFRDIFDLAKELKRDIFHARSYRKACEVYMALGLYDEAEEFFKKSLKGSDDLASSYLMSAKISFYRGEFEKAKDLFLKSKLKARGFILPSEMEFAIGFIEGIEKGSNDAIAPTHLSSPYGLYSLLSFANPEKFPKELIVAAEALLESIIENITYNRFYTVVPTLQNLLYYFYELSPSDIARELGYIIGKYGEDLLLLDGSYPAAQEFFKFQRTLDIFTFETFLGNFQEASENSINWEERRVALIEKLLKGSPVLKPYTKIHFNETATRRVLHLSGIETFPRPNMVPNYFRVRFSSKNGHMKYIHPTDKREYIVVIPGDIDHEIPAKSVPHAIHRRGRYAVGGDGKRISRNSKDAYVPLDRFIYHPKR